MSKNAEGILNTRQKPKSGMLKALRMKVKIKSKIALKSIPVIEKVIFGVGREISGNSNSGRRRLNKLIWGREKLIEGKEILPCK
jgi:hypothetical protein